VPAHSIVRNSFDSHAPPVLNRRRRVRSLPGRGASNRLCRWVRSEWTQLQAGSWVRVDPKEQTGWIVGIRALPARPGPASFSSVDEIAPSGHAGPVPSSAGHCSEWYAHGRRRERAQLGHHRPCGDPQGPDRSRSLCPWRGSGRSRSPPPLAASSLSSFSSSSCSCSSAAAPVPTPRRLEAERRTLWP